MIDYCDVYVWGEEASNVKYSLDLYRGGELLDELESIGPFQEDDAALLMNHVLTCINYIHSLNLAHRDLKPENILLEENMKLDDIKIIDFGLARRTAPGAYFGEFEYMGLIKSLQNGCLLCACFRDNQQTTLSGLRTTCLLRL